MKKYFVIALILTFSLLMGCDIQTIEDLAEVEVEITEVADPITLTVTDTEFSEDIDLTDESDYDDYKDLIDGLEVGMQYRVIASTGAVNTTGTMTFYVTDYMEAFDHASKVQITEPVVLQAGYTSITWTNVNWTADGKVVLEDKLFNERKLSIWGFVDVDPDGNEFSVTVETKFNIKVDANPFEDF